MPRSLTEYVCQQCGSRYPQMYGRCPGCGSWSSLEETLTGRAAPGGGRSSSPFKGAGIQPLADIEGLEAGRLQTGVEEFDRVLGGGIVPGSAILLGGDPGVGKSTLLLQVSHLVGGSSRDVLYVTGEESPEQLKLRAGRLAVEPRGIGVLAESDVDVIIEATLATRPAVLVVDSIQTMQTADLESGAGSIGQIRECAARLVRLAKDSGVAVFLVGHVTKDGALAGPKVLEHMVDVVLYLEGDHFQAYRLLRGIKNRFGATHEIGVFDMRESGLAQVENPSALFMNDGDGPTSGSAIAVTVEGTRPLLVEIQALATRTTFGTPRRSATGFDLNRLNMLTAVLTKRAGVDVGSHDVYVNVVGGLRLVEPAADLATVLAIYSSHRDAELPRAAVFGEVGLSGEIRPVQHVDRRVSEAAKLGVKHMVVPRRGVSSGSWPGVRVDGVSSIADAIDAVRS